MAEAEGDTEKAEDLGLELEELELRAKELDTRRTSTISAIRSVRALGFRALHLCDNNRPHCVGKKVSKLSQAFHSTWDGNENELLG